MGRPRQYDEDEVLDRALDVFWTRGYEATSVQDLMAATGLAKGSVYKGFGDKHSLFLRTLDRYLAQGRANYAALDDGQRPALDVLRDWLGNVVVLAAGCEPRRGCFGVNCVVELAPHDPEVRARMAAHEARLQAMYADTIARGQREGSLRAELDPVRAAAFLSTSMAGINVAGKTGMAADDAAAMVELALQALRTPGIG